MKQGNRTGYQLSCQFISLSVSTAVMLRLRFEIQNSSLSSLITSLSVSLSSQRNLAGLSEISTGVRKQILTGKESDEKNFFMKYSSSVPVSLPGCLHDTQARCIFWLLISCEIHPGAALQIILQARFHFQQTDGSAAVT